MILSYADTLYSVFKWHTLKKKMAHFKKKKKVKSKSKSLMDLTYFFTAAPMKDITGMLIASNIVEICFD